MLLPSESTPVKLCLLNLISKTCDKLSLGIIPCQHIHHFPLCFPLYCLSVGSSTVGVTYSWLWGSVSTVAWSVTLPSVPSWWVMPPLPLCSAFTCKSIRPTCGTSKHPFARLSGLQRQWKFHQLHTATRLGSPLRIFPHQRIAMLWIESSWLG